MITYQRLEQELKYQIEYEALWRAPTPSDLQHYINWAYADIATYSLALLALRQWTLKHNEAGLKKHPEAGARAWEWDFNRTGLYVPYHVLWERQEGSNLVRFSLQSAVQVRPEVLLQNADRASRAPSSVDEHPASTPRVRIFPENRLGAEPNPTGSYPAQYYYHNGRLWLYPEPNPISGEYGKLWIYGAFIPRSNSESIFRWMTDANDEPALPAPLAALIPDLAFFYWARGITDLYPLAEQKRQAALQIALAFRQQMVQIGMQGAPFTENTLSTEMLEQLGGRIRNTPTRRAVRNRTESS